jgi:hypothetical protein
MKDNILKLYHGSDKVIEEPTFGLGRIHNDFGLGFYCTENIELGKEWGVSNDSDGFVNKYIFDTTDLTILQLNSPDYTILNWIAILVNFRQFRIKNPIAAKGKRYLLDNFFINVNAYDVITGYRADDSYFDYAEAFLNNTISVQQLSTAMRLGKLGEQVVIKSQYAFSRLQFDGFECADRLLYYPKRKARNDEATLAYNNLLQMTDEDLYLAEIIKGNIKNDDARIPRNLCK